MKKAIKVAGLLFLGAVFGQAVLIGTGILDFWHKAHDPNFLMKISLLGSRPEKMSDEELVAWNQMGEDIRREKLSDANFFLKIAKDDVGFEVVPARPVFSSGEDVLAEIRIRNISRDHLLHINEPCVQRLTPEIYLYQGLNQLDYAVSLSPLDSTWMRSLQRGEELSVPVLIVATNKGPYKINFSLADFQFDKRAGEATEDVIRWATCQFRVQ